MRQVGQCDAEQAIQSLNIMLEHFRLFGQAHSYITRASHIHGPDTTEVESNNVHTHHSRAYLVFIIYYIIYI